MLKESKPADRPKKRESFTSTQYPTTALAVFARITSESYLKILCTLGPPWGSGVFGPTPSATLIEVKRCPLLLGCLDPLILFLIALCCGFDGNQKP